MAQTPPSVELPAQQDTDEGGTVTPLRPGTNQLQPIPGLRPGWFFRSADRMILHANQREAPPLPIGTVPVLLGRITYRMSDRRHTRIAYQIRTDEGPRIISAEELLDGTWADRAGRDRPVTADERHAYARILSQEVREAEEVPALPVKDPKGGLTLPDVDAQELGYLRTTEPDQAAALTGWRHVFGLAGQADRSTLALAAMFSGPLTSSLHGVPAHILNLTGGGQLGKSTTQRIMCALMGDPTDGSELFGTMNNTGLYLPEVLVEARYLPMCREETSSSALSLPELEKLFSRIVAGAARGRLGKGGKRQPSAGSWHSIFVTSSNESLLRQGQVESLASRLIQLSAPLFADASATAEAWDIAARHHGWPLVWAREAQMFTAERVAEWRTLHGEILGRLMTVEAIEAGGIPLTLGRILASWCVGAYMLGEVLHMPEIGTRAEEDALRELPRILGDVTETHLSPGQILWEALSGAIAQEPASWMQGADLTPERWAGLEYRPRRVLGYYYQGRVHVYVSTLTEVVKGAGIDTPVPGLKELERRGVLIRNEKTKLSSKHPTRELRDAVPGRAYVFDPRAAQEAFAELETPPQATPDRLAQPGEGSVTARSEQRAVTGIGPVPPAQTDQSSTATARRHDVTALTVPPVPAHPPTIAYPAAEEQITDRRWASLTSRAQGRTLSATRIGVLGGASDGSLWLHQPNRTPVRLGVEVTSAHNAADLIQAYKLKTLWVHESALPVMGLPDYDERQELGEEQRKDLPPIDRSVGPMTGVSHPWAELGGALPVKEITPAGLTCWMTLVMEDGSEAGRKRHVAVPAWDHRLDKSGQPGRGGFGGAPTPEVLLDALMVYLLSTEHGPQSRPKVKPYYESPNKTGEDFAGGRQRSGVVCQAIRDKAVPPAAEGLQLAPLMVPQHWHRQPTAEEEQATYLHQYDKTAAWLGAYGATKLGVGEPTHGGEGTLYNKRMAGYWRVADVPGTGPEHLPQFQFREMPEGGYWLTTPSIELLRELYPEWLPRVLESWHWETSQAALVSMNRLMTASRTDILAAIEDGRPGGKWAKQVNSKIYQSFRGYLGRQDPKVNPTTGEFREDDIYIRPDWAHLLMHQATANLYRNLLKFGRDDGRWPLSVYVDAATYTSDQADPEAARPASMQLGTQGGTWSHERSAPIAELGGLDDPYRALDKYTATTEGETL